MVGNLKSKRQEGFTIIEVLIVLAIAGLIMLIVFLAVPALQRNSRNTQRKSDVSALLAAVTEGVNNSNGVFPAGAQFDAAFAKSNPTLAYYSTAANITWVKPNTATAPADPADLDKVTLSSFAKCNATGTAAVTTGATARSVVAVFDLEGSGGSQVPRCQES